MDDLSSNNAIQDVKPEQNFCIRLENTAFPTNLRHKNTVVKYTKIPDFDSKISWSRHNYSLHPRLRRIITVEDKVFDTSRSLKHDTLPGKKMKFSSSPQRKIITIEDELHPYLKISKDVNKSVNRSSTRAIETNLKEEKACSQRTISRISSTSKYAKEEKHQTANTKHSNKVNETIKSNKNQLSSNIISISENFNQQTLKEKDKTRNNENRKPQITSSRNLPLSVKMRKDASPDKQKNFQDSENTLYSKPNDRMQVKKILTKESKSKYVSELKSKSRPVPIIHVPMEEKQKLDVMKPVSNCKRKEKNTELINCSTEMDIVINSRDESVETDPFPKKVNQITEIDSDFDNFCQKIKDDIVQRGILKNDLDSLDIPNVTLTKESKDLNTKDVKNFYSASLPNLQTPIIDINPVKSETITNEAHFRKSSSFIIGRATVTYTTEQKIDFHVVGNNEEKRTNLSPSSFSYPLNVVSVYKKEIKNSQSNISKLENTKKKDKSLKNCLRFSDLNLVNYSHVSDSNKLVKPSDIISTISVNHSLLRSDFICEQFQRELNFIDSFFESLQYLERLTEKCFADTNNDCLIYNKQFHVNESEYISNITKIENGPNVDDNETMASKSLCQLNLLIHNEQRRAKEFLFVLKMQEDVLKDYIKSQMLWLEKKKKQDNIDISALKKKQRGALLKLQHECGEMQRMRKALLTLSEKRKVALMKTKKNIEMKLKNNMDVDQIILGKKKLKRNSVSDRCLTPLKCFDLSSSGCEDSTSSRPKSESACFSVFASDATVNPAAKIITSAEKSIQTGESILAIDLHDHLTSTAAENYIVVDGGYLNILFHNLSLPQIFSNGKQYEVNEEALRNIVNSSNCHNVAPNDTGVIEKFMEQIKNYETDGTSTPSTAHSLVEEFDHYYKSLGEEEKSLTNSPECENLDACERKDCVVQTEANNDSCEDNNISMISMDSDESLLKRLSNVYGIDRSCVCRPAATCAEIQTSCCEVAGPSVAGPLPVPAGEAAPDDTAPQPDVSTWTPPATPDNTETLTNNQVFCSTNSPMSPYTSTVHYEAEELRRQQLAIEREIKALEQQQCQLLVVREIPDKPPPPYTPPSDSRMPKVPRMFSSDSITEEKIHKHFIELANDVFDLNDPFDVFVKDFCQESIERQKAETSDKPWDACNLLPQKPQPDAKEIVHKTYTELREVLSGVSPASVSGVASRRSDQIDDILFSEWRRCEPEWTSLHTDEAIVKNQLFESIFQKILTETMDEYKRIVCVDKDNVKK